MGTVHEGDGPTMSAQDAIAYALIAKVEHDIIRMYGYGTMGYETGIEEVDKYLKLAKEAMEGETSG